MKHSRPERLGQKKGCGFPGSRERQLYCIFIQPVECSLDFADSRADPENSSFSAQSVSAGTRRLPRSCSSCWPSNAMDLALCAARRAAANDSSGQTRLRAVETLQVRLRQGGRGRGPSTGTRPALFQASFSAWLHFSLSHSVRLGIW